MLLLLLGLLAAWTAASLLWAGSRSNAWEETNRTLFYLVAVALVVVLTTLLPSAVVPCSTLTLSSLASSVQK